MNSAQRGEYIAALNSVISDQLDHVTDLERGMERQQLDPNVRISLISRLSDLKGQIKTLSKLRNELYKNSGTD